MKVMEFVSSRGHAVVNVCFSVRLECKCGKESLVDFDTSIVHGYYDGVDLILEVKCPHCGAEYEKNVY